MKIIFTKLIAAVAIITAITYVSCSSDSSSDEKSPGGNGSIENPYKIKNANQLALINENLSANYILEADIDLSSYDNWAPIGLYEMDPESEEGEDPVAEKAFTGSFDGNNHTIANLKIDKQDGIGVGLFGCTGKGSSVKNLILKDFSVNGMFITGGIVGFAFYTELDNLHTTTSNKDGNSNNKINSLLGLVGSIVGGSTGGSIENCSCEYSDINAGNIGMAGTLGGGLSHTSKFENNKAINCSVTCTLDDVPAMNAEGNFIGGLIACINTPQATVQNCSAENITINVNGKGYLVGGFTGTTGGLLSVGDPLSEYKNCQTKNVKINISGKDIKYIGGFIGGSMYDSAPDALQSFSVTNCSINTEITAEDITSTEENGVGSIAGLAYECSFSNNEITTKYNNNTISEIGRTTK